MLNKLKFNNLVISNKKGIQQSRIQTINKLVHKMRNLKTLLEKRPEDEKCKQRVRKSTETLEFLKKFKRVDIMKKVLLLEKSPAAVITSGLSTPEELAVALLAMNKVMQGLIKRFKKDLELSDEVDSKWRADMMESSKRKQKIDRTEEKRRKRITLKEQKAIDRKRKEWLEQNCENGGNPEEQTQTEFNVSTTGGWKVEEIEKTNIKSERGDNKTINKKSDNKEMPKNKAKLLKKSAQTILKFEDDASEEEQKQKRKRPNPLPLEKQEDSDDESSAETHIVDPFFVTDTGESYLSTAVVKRNQRHEDNSDDDEAPQREFHFVKASGSKKSPNFGDRNSQRYDRENQQTNEKGYWKQKQSQAQRNQQQTQNKWSNNNARKFGQRNDNKNEIGNRQRQNNWAKGNEIPARDRFSKNAKAKPDFSSNAKTEEKLHPSWAAKQKQKPIITGFQGKKIIFGDDGIINETSNVPSTNHTKSIKRESNTLQNPKPDALHPSWAAKQKQKAVITTFQGKKITFDNDD